MLRLHDTLGTEPIEFHYVEQRLDLYEVWDFVKAHKALGLDTESTGINCYKPGWELRSVQVGNAHTAYVIPARFRKAIWEIVTADHIKWIGHNGTHDIRSIDAWIGKTEVFCAGETYLPAHYVDSRKQDEGGTGHGLKELSIAYVSRDAGKWEFELKKRFKQIVIPISGQVYKSGPRKGTQKMRKAKLSEGWGLIDPNDPAYIAYSAADPLLTYRLWKYFQPVIRDNLDLYHFDHALQLAADKLQRRAMRVDRAYTEKLSAAFQSHADKKIAVAQEYGCNNINSGVQIANVLLALGAPLKARTERGQYKTDEKILRSLIGKGNSDVDQFIHAVLGAKQVMKRRENYTEAFLREMDSQGRVHPSINTLAARTARMSVSNPPLQQLPTANHEEDVNE